MASAARVKRRWRVLFIKSAQRIGFNLNEIAQLLQLDGGTR